MSGRATAQTAVINYQSPYADKCRILLITATALLFVLFPLPLVCSIFVLKIAGVWASLVFAISILSLLFFLAAIYAYRINGNTRLILTVSGIGIPTGFYGGWSSGIRLCPWSNLYSISVAQDAGKQETLVLSMKNQAILLRIAALSGDDLDKVISACLLWSDTKSREPSFLELAEKLSSKRLDHSDSSFTGLWMQEASRRLRATPFTPMNPGSKLQGDRVKIVQALAAGGWSAVYLCQWQDKTAAILKEAVVPPAIEEELKQKAYEQFERESVLLAGLDHPNIAKVIDYFVENGRQYMVLQRIPGPNLRTYVKDKGPVSEKQALKWAKEICAILAYLHARVPPILHRDLSPENLVLDMRGSLVLIDFGSANEFIGTVTGTLVGKPSYVSPEQFSGHATLQSDLYSLGAVMHFMSTGQDPEPLTVAHPRLSQAAISEEFDSLVADLMRLNAKERVADIEETSRRLNLIA